MPTCFGQALTLTASLLLGTRLCSPASLHCESSCSWVLVSSNREALSACLPVMRHDADDETCLQTRVVRDRTTRERNVGQGTQELARLRTLVAASRAQLAALEDQISAEHASIAQICSTARPKAGEGRFGIFASAEGLKPGLNCLSVDIQSIHGMDSEARTFALSHLSDRFDQLRALSKHMRDVVTTAACVYDTLDLSDTLDAINQVASELLDAAQVRFSMVDLLRLPVNSGCLLGMKSSFFPMTTIYNRLGVCMWCRLVFCCWTHRRHISGARSQMQAEMRTTKPTSDSHVAQESPSLLCEHASCCASRALHASPSTRRNWMLF